MTTTSTDVQSPYYIGDKFAWDGDALAVTDDKMLSRLNKPYLSASTAKAMDGCQAKYAGEKGLPWTSHALSANELGTASHYVGEKVYQLPPEDRDMEAAHAIIKTLLDPKSTFEEARNVHQGIAKLAGDLVSRVTADLTGIDPDGRIKAENESVVEKALGAPTKVRTVAGMTKLIRKIWLEKVTHNVEHMLTMEDPKSVTVYATELKFDGVKIGGVTALGFIDRIDVIDEGNGTVKVVDYKSGKVPNLKYGDDHGDQIRIYKKALEALHPHLTVTEGELLYITHGEKRKVDLSERAVAASVQKFVKAWDTLQRDIKAQSFPTKPGPLCGWCSLVDSCPVARPKKSASDIRDSAPRAVVLGIPKFRNTVLTDPPAGGKIDASAPATTRSKTMTKRLEDVPYKEFVGPPGADYLNFNSYAATAVVGLHSWAAEILSEHGRKVAPPSIRELAGSLTRIITEAELAISGADKIDWMSGLNTRIRSTLHTYLDLKSPEGDEAAQKVAAQRAIPFGKTAEDFAAWETRVAKFCTSLVISGESLHRGGVESKAFSSMDTLTGDL